MKLFEFRNLETVPLKEIPLLAINELKSALSDKIKYGNRIVQFFGIREENSVRLYAVTADDNNSRLFISSAAFREGESYPSFTPDLPQLHLFEREFYEQTGIKPEGHPWLKPVRKGIAGINSSEEQYKFFSMKGEEVHEVGVGPVHAGIIEPGYFRFSCHGEKVHHLEIELGFQHRGVEDLFIMNQDNPLYLLRLAESIAGDTVTGHCGTFLRAFESLADVSVTKRVKFIRSVLLELERMGNHLGDLAALSNDIAYLTGSSSFGALRTKIINTSMAVCGSRFGRSALYYGGVNFDISTDLQDKIVSVVNEVNDEAALAAEVLFTSASAIERFEKTGIIARETALETGMTGPAARASGSAVDVRSDHPFCAYEYFPFHKLTLNTGDVFSRAYIRFVEIQQSAKIINELLGNIPEGELRKDFQQIRPESLVVSLSEGWRGEISHMILTDKSGRIKKIKIKDPSFNNWFALALAVRNEGISDFPLCNKSFNLSYCGFDL